MESVYSFKDNNKALRIKIAKRARQGIHKQRQTDVDPATANTFHFGMKKLSLAPGVHEIGLQGWSGARFVVLEAFPDFPSIETFGLLFNDFVGELSEIMIGSKVAVPVTVMGNFALYVSSWSPHFDVAASFLS